MTADQIQTIFNICRALSALNGSKLDLEYKFQLAQAKGLVPNPDGTKPDSITITDGLIDGTDIAFDEYALGLAAIAAVVATLETVIVTGMTVEQALLKLSR